MSNTGPSDNTNDFAPREDKEIKPLRNEFAGAELQNTFPKPDEINPRELGMAGVRIKLEGVLNALHGFNDEVFEALALEKRDLARYRKQTIQLLRQMMTDPAENRMTNRSAAVVLFGELAGASGLPELTAVLQSPNERLTTRGWAALTIGRFGGQRAVDVLVTALNSPSPMLRRRAVEGLSINGSKRALAPLRRVAEADIDAVTADLALGSLHQLEDRYQIKRTPLEPRLKPVTGRQHHTVLRGDETY